MISRKLLGSLTAATLAFGLAAAPSFAQPRVVQATFGNLIAALNNINVEVENLELLNDLIDVGDVNIEDVNVTVVNVEDVLNGNNIRALNNVLRNVDIDIQDVLNDNTVIVELLENADIDIDDVVAIDILDTGDILVFVD